MEFDDSVHVVVASDAWTFPWMTRWSKLKKTGGHGTTDPTQKLKAMTWATTRCQVMQAEAATLLRMTLQLRRRLDNLDKQTL